MNLPEKMLLLLLMSLLIFPAVSATAQGAYMYVKTTVYVYPEEIRVKVGETFETYIKIRDVSGLQGFDFMLSYDSTLLDCIALEEGTFLSNANDTFVAKQEINDEFSPGCGRVWLAVAILGKGYADGNGTLAVIRFNATAVGESVLDLYSDYPYKEDEVKLTTCCSEAIPNKALDGHVIIETTNSDPDPLGPVDPPSPDVNGDGIVNIEDLLIIASVYGTVKGDTGYYPNVDLDQNGKIDICDLVIAAQKFGQTV